MTKRDFIAIAAAIRGTLDRSAPNLWPGIILLANNIADYCAVANPRFDRERFMDAATLADSARFVGACRHGSYA